MRARPFARLLGVLLAALAAMTALGPPAHAAQVPPAADTRLAGTWVNTNPYTKSVKQIVIRRDTAGKISVDAFGACTPTLCEWGIVPGTVYGSSVSSTVGTEFRTNQRFLSSTGAEFARTALFGKLVPTAYGLRLTVREFTVFTDGSGRRNFTVTESFTLGSGPSPTKAGLPVSTFPLGLAPAPVSGLYGTWKNVSATPALVKIDITAAPGAPLVRAYGACSPTPCDLGTVRGVTYGTSISSTTGTTVLAPYTFGFKNEQLIIGYSRLSTGEERLTVANFNEFTDGSGRSNYQKTETFVRA